MMLRSGRWVAIGVGVLTAAVIGGAAWLVRRPLLDAWYPWRRLIGEWEIELSVEDELSVLREWLRPTFRDDGTFVVRHVRELAGPDRIFSMHGSSGTYDVSWRGLVLTHRDGTCRHVPDVLRCAEPIAVRSVGADQLVLSTRRSTLAFRRSTSVASIVLPTAAYTTSATAERGPPAP